MPVDDQARATLELWKTVSTLALLGIVGGFISLMYKRFEQQRAAARALHAFRSDFLLKLQGAYRLTKTVRRALRAIGLTTMRRDPLRVFDESQITGYREQMGLLNEAQLDFEDLCLELKVFPDAFTEGDQILTIVQGIEQYLRAILREYEVHWRRLGSDGEGRSSFGSLDRLRDFTGSFKVGDYRPTVVHGRNDAVKLIQADLLPIHVAKAAG